MLPKIETQPRKASAIKNAILVMHFKHPNILRTSDDFSPPIFFLESIIPKTSEIKKLVWP